MFEVVLTNRAIKDLNKFPNDVKSRILTKINDYSISPFDYAIKLTNSELGTYRFHIGDYRVIFDVDINTLIILRIGHRREIYR
ncbi:MAG: type II toxin-antitoxin system RelE/ParE family toxin [Candidatus Kapabacteria bacterium]|nr:type II toxin-antitoxin system RelE/ParE family toxin [Candidatus Kapabacteria bacterium]